MLVLMDFSINRKLIVAAAPSTSRMHLAVRQWDAALAKAQCGLYGRLVVYFADARSRVTGVGQGLSTPF